VRQRAARELDGNRRRVALVDGQDAGADAEAVVALFRQPYDSRMPRKVPTSAAPTFSPISEGGPSMAAIVFTTPSTAATMPRPGSESPTLPSVDAGRAA
jgi:hypothetical protein